MSKKRFCVGLTVVLLFATVGRAQTTDPATLPKDKARETLLSALQQLQSLKLSPMEKGLLDDIELRCHLLLFLTHAGISGRASLQVLENAKQTPLIALGLFHSSTAKKTSALRALVSLNDKTVVPLLATALESNNYIAEGSETVGAHRSFKKELVAAIEKLIGLSLEVTDVEDQRQIVRAIDKAKQWLQGSNNTAQSTPHMPQVPTMPY